MSYLSVSASAPGKAILIGEHFVVENQPAIAIAINLRAHVTARESKNDKILIFSKNLGIKDCFSEGNINIKSPLYPIYYAAKEALKSLNIETSGLEIIIDSEIPPSAGMGSSAAVSVATIGAILKLYRRELNKEKISKMAYKAEEIVHGKPSGIDNTISTYGGSIIFRKSEGFLKLISNFSDVKVILADSEISRNTGNLVRKVLRLKNKYERIFDPLYYSAGHLAIEAAKAIENMDFKRLGELMNINHGLLSAIGVSNRKLEELVYVARENGALGAKITGAGGGGFIVALCYKKDYENVFKALKKVSNRVFVCDISDKGII